MKAIDRGPDVESLSPRQLHIAPIAAFTANGDQAGLKTALHAGLDAGLSISEIQEVMVQLYAYAGFPRSLNALNTFMDVLDKRKAQGRNDASGKAPNPMPSGKTALQLGTDIQTRLVGEPLKRGVFVFAPVIDTFLKQHLFGDIFGRDNLGFVEREIATISALASLEGVASQLQSHVKVGRNVGISDTGLAQLAETIALRVGWSQGERIRSTAGLKSSSFSGTAIQRVTFPNRNITIVGNLYLPAGYDSSRKYPAIIVGHPAGGVKEQVAGLYAGELAAKGFVTLAFDASYQGESGGEPRYLEDPATRVEDFRAATDFLSRHSTVDPERIGVLGICAGGGFAIKAAQTEHRIRAVAGVSAVDLGQLRRNGLGGVLKAQMQKRLDDAGKQRTAEAAGAPLRYANYVSNTLEEIPANAPAMYREGYEYYRTSRGMHANAPNKYVFTSLDKLMGFTAFDQMELISPRPLLMIAGSKADSYYFSQQAYDRALQPKELFSVPGASHIDMYDKPGYVKLAVQKLNEFFGKYLK